MNPIRHWLDAAEEFANDKNIEGALRALITGVTILSERLETRDPRVFRHNWTDEELAQREKIPGQKDLMDLESKCACQPSPERKPLTWHTLKEQVDQSVWLNQPPVTSDFVWFTENFEIRRRK
jgi:hypothetical protein